MTRIILLLAPAAFLFSCSPRVYYRTLETEEPQTPAPTRTKTESTLNPVKPELPVQTEGEPSPSATQVPNSEPASTPTVPAPSSKSLTAGSRA